MAMKVKQVSSLEKIMTKNYDDAKTIYQKTVMGGESFSYQLAICPDDFVDIFFTVQSPLKEAVSLYEVRNTVMDLPIYSYAIDDDYITRSAGTMPDLLLPLEAEKPMRLVYEAGALWVEVNVPENTPAGTYSVEIDVRAILVGNGEVGYEGRETMQIEVLPCNIPTQKTIYTQWFHTDCIADYHNVPVYSEAHWELIDAYMALYAKLGGNMILTPIITPPLDTGLGIRRTNVQLVDFEKKGHVYSFDFSRLVRWISLVNKNGIRYFEMSPLFSQWGLAYTPNILVKENGEESYLFGWEMDSHNPEYKNFLSQFLPALIDFAKEQGIKERLYFHISDEPNEKHLDAYRFAHDLIVPLIDGCPTMDALSNYAFYEKGLVPVPVTSIADLAPFLENKVENQWGYYCCSHFDAVSNRFMAMPSYRNRIIGLQIYKFGLVGFLHWGYNFYNSMHSRKQINPYLTSSAEGTFPSGDAFSVYPVKNGVAPSLRALVFKEALTDVEVCRKLEEYIGKDAVVKMIDDAAGMDLTFKDYPRQKEFIPNLMNKMMEKIKTFI